MNKGQNYCRFTLPADILAILRCPACHLPLAIAESGVYCKVCDDKFPAVNGVIRFTGSSNYAESFGFQWFRFARTQLDRDGFRQSEKDFRERTGFVADDLVGKLVLDVGCGMGRFAEVATRWGARVVGIDLSQAAEVAAENLSDQWSATFFQADVFALPFAPESFDYIYSLGVLHHTPDCERAFKVLPSLLKPGGTIAIWLYSAYNNWYRSSDLYRKVTHRLPKKVLLTLCQVAVPLYYLHKGLRHVPLIGKVASAAVRFLLPTNLDPNAEVRVLDTFDWYSPRYQSKHTYEQVSRWFEACGLDSIRVLEQAVSLRGRRPKIGSEAHSEAVSDRA
jgi:2-polyprenyl-3-methyl-5-hydroxy-6-metoxy-1,4-benzoquinol methylase